jgi:hypothetical protein
MGGPMGVVKNANKLGVWSYSPKMLFKPLGLATPQDKQVGLQDFDKRAGKSIKAVLEHPTRIGVFGRVTRRNRSTPRNINKCYFIKIYLESIHVERLQVTPVLQRPAASLSVKQSPNTRWFIRNTARSCHCIGTS